MSVTFAEKLRQLPHYEGGKHVDRARAEGGGEGLVKLNSNECPWEPHPAVVEAIERAARDLHRYPDQHATRLRRRIAERFDYDPAGIAVSNGSCEILLAAAHALCEPGAEIVYAWPAFSMYPHLAPLSGAREIRVPLDDEGVHDLEAMIAEVTAATQILILCNPNNPTSTHVPAERVGDLLERVPDHVTVILDEAYIEFQTNDDPDATVEFARRHPNAVVLRTFSKVYGLAGVRVGYALCSPGFRRAVDAVRQPFSVNSIAQAAASEAILHQDFVAERVERTIVERVRVGEGVAELGLECAESQANFSWIDLGDRDEGALVDALAEQGVLVRAGSGLGGPGHVRVNYGTRAEDERFLEALGRVL